MDYYLQSVQEVEEKLKTKADGLTSEEARKRLEEYGKNILQAKKRKTVLSMFLRQFTDFMILILIAAAAISGFLGDLTDTIVILAIVIINAIVGVVQEWRAEKAMDALQRMAASRARVMRDNQSTEIASEELVPGDVITLEAGNVIPADIRFKEVYTLKVDESTLTGESVNVEKTADTLSGGEYSLGDRINMGYRGTSITNGRATGYVVGTGMKTEFGRIAEMIQTDETKNTHSLRGIFLYWMVSWRKMVDDVADVYITCCRGDT
jgi:P-type Ca2+ transporter type 2C